MELRSPSCAIFGGGHCACIPRSVGELLPTLREDRSLLSPKLRAARRQGVNEAS